MPISIPQYKPISNLCLAENMSYSSSITSFGSDLNGLSFGQRIANNSPFYLNSSEYTFNSDLKPKSKIFNNRSENSSEEPLDLSLRKKSLSEKNG